MWQLMVAIGLTWSVSGELDIFSFHFNANFLGLWNHEEPHGE